MRENSETVRVNVTVADTYMKDFDDVVRRCKRAGLDIEQTLPEIGLMTGMISSEKLASLEELKGVASVEREQSLSVPPPDSPVQ